MNFFRIIVDLLLCIVSVLGHAKIDKQFVSLADLQCNTSQALLDEIHSYQDVVNDIIELFTTGNFKGKIYDLLAELTDTYGSRLTGSQTLEDTIDWILANAIQEGFTAYTENVTVPKWVRNNESLRMVTPRDANIAVLGLGTSVGTPPEGIVAEVHIVSSFDELYLTAADAIGKIVLYDVPFTSYGKTVQYRASGATEAAKVGAVASIIRSVEDFSMVSPHTGANFYDDGVPKIPAVAISIEDSDFTTRNTIIDTPGSVNPEEVVVVSGHLDSWDVGVGAMDDGGGVVISWIASRALTELGLVPRRTYRTIMFTGEEQGIWGGDAYFTAHRTEKGNFQLMMESDHGTFTPYGIDFSGTDEAACLMKEIVSLTSLIGTTTFRSPADQSDLGGFLLAGVPIGSLNSDTDRYMWYHHSNADRLDVYVSEDLDKVGALWTAVSYVAANVTFRLPQRILPTD